MAITETLLLPCSSDMQVYHFVIALCAWALFQPANGKLLEEQELVQILRLVSGQHSVWSIWMRMLLTGD